ncbi:MAG: Methyltransferase type 11 [Microgenomates group bacterium GW2011_GWA1_48_10]|uniref:Methyltransferase type 11 domain-containing protein n=1 Tax=Candidatus Gottesmanbacteria bacterium RIFCSPHIGHO2_01_FULL_47_48 TaxID=1798381 RepID=A0A1F6A3B9_9BACT|nr:MAG: Methyltransferase type 11 [Microgenomates group bacterium GW2011_GWA1_48_10]OGG19159.1 MAG: hypothetical protein A2721_01945 [Candidatus Gottesmanbacteria bacterium RIFCSPHIGHO2_01_FULL_47_48]
MEISEYKNIYENEETHGWYQGMKYVSLALLDRFLERKQKLKILDAGCGTGMMIKALEKYGKVEGIDISPEAIKLCKKRGLKNVQIASVMKIPFKSESFDLVTSFDVIYHQQIVPNQAIREFSRVLKKGGVLLLRVPALEILRGSHDKVVHTASRFTLEEVNQLLENNHLKLEFSSYVNFFIFPLTLLTRMLSRRNFQGHTSDIGHLPTIVNLAVENLLKLETLFLRNAVTFPIGVSIIAVASKK